MQACGSTVLTFHLDAMGSRGRRRASRATLDTQQVLWAPHIRA